MYHVRLTKNMSSRPISGYFCRIFRHVMVRIFWKKNSAFFWHAYYILQLNELSLPDHWMKYFFVAQVYLELQLNNDALRCYEKLKSSHFARSTYVMSQLAMAYHNIRGLYLTFLYFELWLAVTLGHNSVSSVASSQHLLIWFYVFFSYMVMIHMSGVWLHHSCLYAWIENKVR